MIYLHLVHSGIFWGGGGGGEGCVTWNIVCLFSDGSEWLVVRALNSQELTHPHYISGVLKTREAAPTAASSSAVQCVCWEGEGAQCASQCVCMHIIISWVVGHGMFEC